MKRTADNYTSYQSIENPEVDPKIVRDSFMAGAVWGMAQGCKIDTRLAWKVYNFINDYKSGQFGVCGLQEAIDKNFENYK